MKLSKTTLVIALSLVTASIPSHIARADDKPPIVSQTQKIDSTVNSVDSTVELSTSGDYDDSDVTGDYSDSASQSLFISAFVDKGIPVINIENKGRKQEIGVHTKLPEVEPSVKIKERQSQIISLSKEVESTKDKVEDLEAAIPSVIGVSQVKAPVAAAEALLKTHLTALSTKEEKALKIEAEKARKTAEAKALAEKKLAEEKQKAIEAARKLAADKTARELAEKKKLADAKAKAEAAAKALKLKEEQVAKAKEEQARKIKEEKDREARESVSDSEKQEVSEAEEKSSDSSSSSDYLPSNLPSTIIVTVGDKSSAVYQCKVPSGDSLLKPWPQRVRSRIVAQFGITNIGGTRPGDPQDHGQGLALDVMVPVSSKIGDEIAQWAIDNSSALNIKYVIWKQHIWAPYRQYWKAMEDRGGVTANHYDHVHISFNSGSGTCPA